MTELNQVYKCNVCGNIVEVVHAGAGELVCCGQPMVLEKEKNQDEGMEKHVPVSEKTEKGVFVKVGSTPHPMEENHHIEWIEIITKHRVYRKAFDPADQNPQGDFALDEDIVKLRAYCNVHRLWVGQES